MSSPLPRFSIYLDALRLSLAVSAVVDFGVAVSLLTAPEPMARLLGLPLPGEPFYLWLLAVVVAMLGAFYALAAYDPRAYSGNILVAIIGRAAAGVALGLATVGRPDLSGLIPLAAADFGFAVVHLIFWIPTLGRRGH